MTIEVVAFDVYGTLAQWPPDRVQPFEIQQLLARYDISISYQAFEAARQAVFFLDAQQREIHGYIDFLALVFDRMGARVTLDLIESIAAMYETRNNMEVYPDALTAIETAKSSGKTCCAFTTLPKFMLGRAAEVLLPSLNHYFDLSAVGLVKGDRRYYERIGEKLSTEAQAILAVGDDPICDCRIPSGVGWRVVLLDRLGEHGDLDAGQKGTISSLSALTDYY
ncbi:MAG: HAD family hydrolase [Phycisphaerales bacterium]|nr:HAD family hydrolase [Phycisphaerales bacterium]